MCKTELTSGEVSHDTCSDRALSPAERSAGRILTCRASPLSSCVVRPLNLLGPSGASFSGCLGLMRSIESLSLPVDVPLMVVSAQVEAAENLGAWRPGHWGWLESLDGRGIQGSLAACFGGVDLSDSCVGYWVLHDPHGEGEPVSLKRDLGTVIFLDGPHGTPYDADIAENPFIVVADALGMPFVGALAWQASRGDALRAEAVLCVGITEHPSPATSCPGNALSSVWYATASADQYPTLFRQALSACASEAVSTAPRMRIVARGASGFQNMMRRAIRGSGVKQWDVSVESTLDLESVPPQS